MSYVFANQRYHDLHGSEGRFHAVLGRLVQKGSFENTTLIIPTGRRQRMLDRMITREMFALHKKPVPDIPMYTLEQFAKHVYSLIIPKGTYRIISDPYRNMLFEEAMVNVDLPFYRGLGTTLSRQTIDKCAEVLYGLRKDGILSSTLNSEVRSANPKDIHGIHDIARISDLSTILHEYEQILEREYLLDYPALLGLITQAIIEQPQSIRRYGTIIMDGFSEFTEPEWLFLDALERSETAFACFLEYDPENGPLFGNFDQTFGKLGNTGFKPHKMDFSEGVSEPLHNHLRHYLFSGKRPQAKPEFAQPFTILECINPQSEVDAIARYVRWIHSTQNIPLSDIVIAMRNPEQYSGLFREIFPLHGLPVNITDRPKLHTSPVIIAMFLLFDIIRHSCRIEDIRTILMNPYISLPGVKTTHELLQSFDEIIRTMRIKGGKGLKEWERSFNSFSLMLSRRLMNETMQIRPNGDVITRIEKKIEEVKQVSGVIKTLQELLIEEHTPCNPEEAINTMKSIIDKSGIVSYLEVLSKHQHQQVLVDIHQTSSELIERDVRAMRAFFLLLDEYKQLRMHRNPNIKASFKEHLERIVSIVHGSQFQIREKPGTGITVTSMEQIRELEYSTIILCGMHEGSSPLAYTADMFMGRELPDSEERHIRRERMSFYLSLVHHAPSNRPRTFLLTYPALSSDLHDLMRSHFLDELMLVTGMNAEEDICKQSFMNDERTPFLRYLTSKEEYIDVMMKQQHNLDHLVYKQIEKWTTSEQIKRKHAPTAIIPDERQSFSITELNEYARCHYQYFAKRILRFAEEETSTMWMSALENGLFFHHVLHQFYTSPLFPINDRYVLKPLSMNPDKRDVYRGELFRIAEREFRMIDFQHPFMDIERQTIFGNPEKGIKGRLDMWFDMEWKNMQQSQYKPALFEISFGNKGDTIPAIDLGKGLFLKGKIDRIELSDDASSFVIADYKTGKNVPGNADINKGKEQQMPLYALAAQKFLQSEYGLEQCTPHHAVYYSLHNCTSKIVMDPEQKRSVALTPEELLPLSQNYVASIHAGDFELKAKKDQDCEHCSFMTLCRIHAIPPIRGEVGPDEEGT